MSAREEGALDALARRVEGSLLEGRPLEADAWAERLPGSLRERLARACAPNSSAAARLDFAALFGVLERAAGASPRAPTGDLAPLPQRAPVATPLDSAYARALLRALRVAPPAASLAEEAARARVPADLRLLSAWVEALEDEALGEVSALGALPAFGEAAREALARCDLRDASPARRGRQWLALGALGAAPDLSRELERALRDGSALERAYALRALAECAPARARTRALAWLAAPRATLGEKRAALEVLGRSASARAVEALVRALGEEPTVRSAALDALVRSPAPARDAALCALLRGGRGEEGETPRRLRWSYAARAAGLLLRERPSRSLRAALLEALREEPDPAARAELAEALGASPGAQGRRALREGCAAEEPELAAACVRALLGEAPARAALRMLAPKSLATEAGAQAGRVLLEALPRLRGLRSEAGLEPLARRCVALLGDAALGPAALRALGALGVRGTGALLAERARALGVDEAAAWVEAAAATGDPSAGRPLLACLREPALEPLRWLVLEALEQAGTAELAEELEALCADISLSELDAEAAQRALETLRARRRPRRGT